MVLFDCWAAGDRMAVGDMISRWLSLNRLLNLMVFSCKLWDIWDKNINNLKARRSISRDQHKLLQRFFLPLKACKAKMRDRNLNLWDEENIPRCGLCFLHWNDPFEWLGCFLKSLVSHLTWQIFETSLKLSQPCPKEERKGKLYTSWCCFSLISIIGKERISQKPFSRRRTNPTDFWSKIL